MSACALLGIGITCCAGSWLVQAAEAADGGGRRGFLQSPKHRSRDTERAVDGSTSPTTTTSRRPARTSRVQADEHRSRPMPPTLSTVPFSRRP